MERTAKLGVTIYICVDVHKILNKASSLYDEGSSTYCSYLERNNCSFEDVSSDFSVELYFSEKQKTKQKQEIN